MSKILDRIDSIRLKVANLKRSIRTDAKKSSKPKLDLDDKIDEELMKQRAKPAKKNGVQSADEALIDLPKAVKEAKKRKDSQPTTPTALFKSIVKTVETTNRNGKQAEKTTIKSDSRETRRSPVRTKVDSTYTIKPLALSKRK